MMCHQANDFQVTEEEWQRLRREIDRFHADGRCVIFVGYEWSGMTPGGGDRNVMYRGDVASLHRSSHAEVEDMADAATDCFPVTELFGELPRARRRDADPPHRRPLRGHRGLPRSRARARDRDLLGLGPLRVAARGRAPPGLPASASSPTPTATRAGRERATRRLHVRRLRRAHLRAVGRSLTRDAMFDAIGAAAATPTTAAQRIHVELAVDGLPMGARGRGPGPVRDRRPRGGHRPDRAGGRVPRARARRQRPPYTAASFEGSTPLPRRVGGLARAGPRPAHDVGRAPASCRRGASSTRCRSRWRTRRRASSSGPTRACAGSPTPPATTTAWT